MTGFLQYFIHIKTRGGGGGGGVGAGVIKNCLQKNPVNQVKASSTNYSRPSLSRLRLSGITAYLEEKI